MITVKQAVQEIMQSSEYVLEAIRQGVFNRTAFAKKIQKEVEDKTMKKVNVNTIVVTLLRIEKNLEKIPLLQPTVYISDLNIKSPIYEITFEMTSEILKRITELPISSYLQSGYFSITQGNREITIICSENLKESVISKLKIKPKSEYKNLTGITVSFSKEYINIPNVIYTILGKLASKRINLTEIVSTYTELTFIFDNKYTQEAVEALKPYFQKT